MSDLQRPPRIFSDDSYYAFDVTVLDNTLYISSGEQGLNIFDITDPGQPETLGHYSELNILSSEVRGNFCYIASGSDGFNILDISNPANPELCSTYMTNNAQSVILAGNHAIIADGEGGVLDIDITDPYRPESFESLKLSYTSSVDVSDNIILVADKSGLYTIQSFQYGKSFKISDLKTEGNANSITVSGNNIYIADHSKGFLVLSLDDPANISNSDILFQIDSEYAEQIIIDENKLYLADGAGGIKIYDLINNKPILSDIISVDGNVKSLLVTNEYILSAAGSGGIQGKVRDSGMDIPLEAVDDRNRRYSADISIVLPDARDLLFFENYLYVTDRKKGLVIIDFTNPDIPVIKGEIPLPGAISIDRNDDLLYIAHADGVTIFDIDDKIFPEKLTTIESFYVEDIKIVGTILYIAEGHAGLSVYDVKDSTKVLKVSSCEEVFADSVTVVDDYAYIADSTGMNVVKIYIPLWIKQRY